MSALPTPAIRLRVDPTNPGHVFACCGVLELADRAWGGAEGWFEQRVDFFCVAPLRGGSHEFDANGLLCALREAKLANTRMSDEQRTRLDELGALKKKGKGVALNDALRAEKEVLEALWDKAKDAALYLGPPFDLRLDWHLDDQSGGSRFKTWAGQQTITLLADDLKSALVEMPREESDAEWLFTRVPCRSSFHFDAVDAGSDIDVGFSFDPLKISSPDKRALVDFLALVGLQRFRPRQVERENLYTYATWLDVLVPEVACAAAACKLSTSRCRTFAFRLLYRTKYLKSFLPALPRGDHA